MDSELTYFIEHKETREWWAGQDKNDNPVWTKDPMRAYPFEDKSFASIRAWAYKLGQITEITEHMFVDKGITIEEAKEKIYPDGGGIYLIDGKYYKVHCDEYHMHSFKCLSTLRDGGN